VGFPNLSDQIMLNPISLLDETSFVLKLVEAVMNVPREATV